MNFTTKLHRTTLARDWRALALTQVHRTRTCAEYPRTRQMPTWTVADYRRRQQNSVTRRRAIRTAVSCLRLLRAGVDAAGASAMPPPRQTGALRSAARHHTASHTFGVTLFSYYQKSSSPDRSCPSVGERSTCRLAHLLPSYPTVPPCHRQGTFSAGLLLPRLCLWLWYC